MRQKRNSVLLGFSRFGQNRAKTTVPNAFSHPIAKKIVSIAAAPNKYYKRQTQRRSSEGGDYDSKRYLQTASYRFAFRQPPALFAERARRFLAKPKLLQRGFFDVGEFLDFDVGRFFLYRNKRPSDPRYVHLALHSRRQHLRHNLLTAERTEKRNAPQKNELPTRAPLGDIHQWQNFINLVPL